MFRSLLIGKRSSSNYRLAIIACKMSMRDKAIRMRLGSKATLFGLLGLWATDVENK